MLNVIVLTGRLVRDPDLRQNQNGTSIGKCTLAVDGNKTRPDGTKETLFIDVRAFGNSADVLGKFVRKGDMLGVQGRLSSYKYTNKEGVEVRGVEVIAERIDLFPKAVNGAKNEKNEAIPPEDRDMFEDFQKKEEAPAEEIDVSDDLLPF